MSRRLKSILLAALGGALMTAGAATSALAADAEVVVVTGSRIPTTNSTSTSPLSVITADQIRMTSAYSVGDILTKMSGPDTTGGATSSSNNGGVGLSEIGLRNLGPTRTLVLVDGERLIPIFSNISSVFSTPDLNTVPVAMIERIEVLRDGASSIYGADAIGGVINIITKKDFEGLQFDASGGVSQHGGGDDYSLSATLGLNIESKGNVTITILNEHESPVDQKDREWAQDPHIGDPNFEGGSIYRSQINLLTDENSHTVWDNGVETTYNDPSLGALPCLKYLPGAGRVKLNAGCPSIANGGQTLDGELGRTQISLNGHYDITPDVTFIAQGFYTRRESEQRLRPEPLLGSQIASTNPYTGDNVFGGFMIPVDWPGYTDPNGTASPIPFDPTGVGCKDPNGCISAILTPNEFGPRDYKQISNTYRMRFGLEGHVFGDFNWEAGYVLQRNDTSQAIANSGNWYRLAEETGQTPCVDAPGGCTFSPLFGYKVPTTPFNFFNGFNSPNALSPAQIKYLTFTAHDTNNANQDFGYADINGTIWDLPAGPLQASVGAERRFEHLDDNPDTLVQEGYAAGPAAATSGGYNVTSAYAELRIPILKNVPFAQSLVITPSGRYDHYSNFGDAETWKIGADWQMIDDLRFRGTYATGFRAPSAGELFAGAGVSYIPVSGDPCDSRAPGFNGNANAGTASLAAGSPCFTQLTAQGLTPAQIATYQSPENNLSNDQRGLVVGGNPTLKPETSHSWNLGAVITPHFAPGLSIDVDYYDINIHNSIFSGGVAQNAGPDVVVNGCYVNQIQSYCDLITRNGGGIFQINSQNTNFGRTHTAGLDMQATYSTQQADLDLPIPGSLTFNIEALRDFTYTTQNPPGAGTAVNHLAGYFLYSNESVQPDWKGTLNIDWVYDAWTVHYDGQFIGGTKNQDGSAPVYGNEIPDYFYHNVSVAYDIDSFFGDNTAIGGTRITFGINNLFDKDPPFLGADGTCKCNSIAGPYDFVGRFFYTRLAIKTN